MSKKKNKYNFKTTTVTFPSDQKYSIPKRTPPLHDLHPYFSFRYYHQEHKKYNFNDFSRDEFLRLVDRLRELSQFTWKQILIDHSRFWHAHEVNWSKTDEQNGFAHLEAKLQGYPPYQLKMFEECRIFGFINNDNIFKIVWIDRHHEISPRE